MFAKVDGDDRRFYLPSLFYSPIYDKEASTGAA
jgi:hypothetical protein